MALRNPYASSQHSDFNPHKDKDDQQTSTSAFPLQTQHTVDNKESMINKKSSNSIRTTNDVENDKKNLSPDLTNIHSITTDLNSTLLNQENNESLLRPSTLLMYVNHH